MYEKKIMLDTNDTTDPDVDANNYNYVRIAITVIDKTCVTKCWYNYSYNKNGDIVLYTQSNRNNASLIHSFIKLFKVNIHNKLNDNVFFVDCNNYDLKFHRIILKK
jgi:hypothetical protein